MQYKISKSQGDFGLLFFCTALDYVDFWSGRRVFGEEGLWACEAPSSPKALLPCGLKKYEVLNTLKIALSL